MTIIPMDNNPMDNEDKEELVLKLKDKLLGCIYDAQTEYKIAGTRYSENKSTSSAKLSDALARVFCFATNSTCAAVYLNTQEKQVLLSVNSNKLMYNNIQDVWRDIISKKIQSNQYVNKYIGSLTSDYQHRTINGYISVKNCLQLNLYLVDFKNAVTPWIQQYQDTIFGRLIDHLDKLQTKVGNFLHYTKKNSVSVKKDEIKKLYTEAINQAHSCNKTTHHLAK